MRLQSDEIVEIIGIDGHVDKNKGCGWKDPGPNPWEDHQGAGQHDAQKDEEKFEGEDGIYVVKPEALGTEGGTGKEKFDGEDGIFECDACGPRR